jgi:hypothetical protein
MSAMTTSAQPGACICRILRAYGNCATTSIVPTMFALSSARSWVNRVAYPAPEWATFQSRAIIVAYDSLRTG